MEMVRIVHPEAGESYVPESAVPAWRSSGWELASEAEDAEGAETGEGAGSAEQDKAEDNAKQDSKPSRSRRRSTEESE